MPSTWRAAWRARKASSAGFPLPARCAWRYVSPRKWRTPPSYSWFAIAATAIFRPGCFRPEAILLHVPSKKAPQNDERGFLFLADRLARSAHRRLDRLAQLVHGQRIEEASVVARQHIEIAQAEHIVGGFVRR